MDKNKQFYDLLAYTASAAREMYIDPEVYAPLRLLSVMLRLIEMVQEEKGLDQVFLQELRQMILDNRSLLLNEREQFGLFLDKLVARIAVKNFA
ncbi:MAG: DUF6092 family protein [Firmicutes bacterium]|nr:DUF6092 family protein [Bacillota bacterium]